jgi:toxin ParE1/3/4
VREVLFHSEATGELEKAVSFYEERRSGLGRAFLDEVEHAISRIQEHPGTGPPYKDTQFHHYVLRRFPYVVFYLEMPEAIWIAAVAHGRRRPGYWKHRTLEQGASDPDAP